MKTKKLLLTVSITIILLLIFGLHAYPRCTDVSVGKDASVDGSVMTSHTGCCKNSRVHLVPAQDFPKGAMAPVYWGLQDVRVPLYEYGRKIGEIPQVEHTYAYFHTGYPQMSAHQLGIGETTTSQKKELIAYVDVSKQIMTIEQAQVFAMQRCKTARDAIKVVTELVEKYGFLPSCTNDAETLCIADPNELWILEVFSVGPDWEPDSGELGALWAAQRVPDDHVKVNPNCSTIREIDLSNPDYFMASENYMQIAIDHGWYDPESGKPFIWCEAYAPAPTEGNMNRIWLFSKMFNPSVEHHTWDPLHYYPFSFKPEKKLSVLDIATYQRSTFEDTIFSMTEDLDWYVSDGKGGMMKSPMATPFPSKDLKELLDITWHRPIAVDHGYCMISQSRNWLPDEIGGVYWFNVDDQIMCPYVPIYSGVREVSPLYTTLDFDNYSDDSVHWAIEFVATLVNIRWQMAIEDVLPVRESLEARMFADQSSIEQKALELYKQDPEKAKDFLTNYSKSLAEEVLDKYHDLRNVLISKYAHNKSGAGSSYRGDNFAYPWPR